MTEQEDLRTVLRGNSQFSRNLSKKLQVDGKNALVSPINIYSTLALVSQDPWFYNKHAFNTALHIPNVNVAAERYKDVSALLNRGDDVSMASRAFLKDNHELQDNFSTRITNNFSYDVNHIDFNRREDAGNVINNWIVDKTFDMTKMDPDSLSNSCRLTLLNAIHFGSKWTQPFRTEDTVPATFHVSHTETVEVQMMKMKSEFYFKNDLLSGAKILELPFVNSDISLVVILPTSKTNLCYSVNILDYDLTVLTADLVKQEVDVALPKFTIEENMELKQHLSELGLSDAFNADLFEMVKDEDINLDQIQQKTFISVNEKGAEAAAGTMSNLTASDDGKDPSKDGIIIYEMNMNTDITNRFAKTDVVWALRNIKNHANMVNFKVVLT